MNYSVHVVEKATKEIVENIPCNSKQDADTILLGVKINLNHAEFKAEIVGNESPGLYCSRCNTHLMVKDICTIYCPNKNCGM